MIPAPLSPIADHLWQSTAFAGAIAVIQFLQRQNRAAVRHRLWVAASIKFLIPFSLLTTIGGYFPWNTAAGAPSSISIVANQATQPFTAPQTTLLANSPALPSGFVLEFVIGIWILGFLGVTLWRLQQWRKLQCAKRRGRAVIIESFAIPAVSCPDRVEPGIFGIVRPVLLLPQGITERLTAEQFRSVLAHERCHVERRDNLTAALHMFVELLFWFHPLVWWLRGRLVAEQEQACDEAVLGLGQDPQVYAESILKICEFYLTSPLACVSGITGADLKTRIRQIMIPRTAVPLTFARKALLASGAVLFVAGPVLSGSIHSKRMGSYQEQGSSQKEFEVVSIKPSHSPGNIRGGECHGVDSKYTLKEAPQAPPLGRCVFVRSDLMGLVQNAYFSLIRPLPRMTGWEKWMESDEFDVEAKAEDPAHTTEAQLQSMLLNMLYDRFKLRTHFETADTPGLALVVDRKTSALKEYVDDGTGPHSGSMSMPAADGQQVWKANNLSGEGMAHYIGATLHQPVMDKTGLSGFYDFTITWAPSPGEAHSGGNANGPTPIGPSFVTALREQLGLKLEPQKVPVHTLVIDHAEKPAP